MFMVLISSMDIASDARPFQSEDPFPPGVGTFGPFSSGTLLPAYWAHQFELVNRHSRAREATGVTADSGPLALPHPGWAAQSGCDERLGRYSVLLGGRARVEEGGRR